MATLVLENLDLWYGRSTHAVDQVNLVVEDGELCVLLGPSGCGKTSTLRMIAGFVRPTGGAIYLDDRRIDHLYPGDRNIAMIFQSYALYPHMRVHEQLAFPLKATDVPPQEIRQRVREMIDFLQMHEFADRYPSELSAGQRQRVAVGRALIRRPRIFLMDEPLSQLDARLRVEMRANLRRLQQDLNITTVYVTHDQMEAQGLGDKIVIMRSGQIQQVGSPLQVYEEPANLFVAGFIGTPPMNFIACHVSRRGRQAVLHNGHFALAVDGELGRKVDSISPDRSLILGIRPEHLRLSPEGRPNAVPAEVYVLEPQSNELIVDLRLGGQVWKVRSDKRELGFKPQVGQKLWLTFPEQHMYLFDARTEERLI